MNEAILNEVDISTTTPKVVATGVKHEFDCKYSDAKGRITLGKVLYRS